MEELSELDLLKKRADQMGIKYHHKIGAVKLNKKIQEHMGQQADEETFPDEVEPEQEQAETAELPLKSSGHTKRTSPLKETKLQRNTRLRKDATKLVRVNVSCMNPAKKDYEGEYYTAGNGVVGFHTKYIQFNTEDGWHIPNILYKHLLERKCQVFYTVKGPRGNKIRKGKLISEFAIQVLPPLNKKEMIELARQQSMAGTIGTD